MPKIKSFRKYSNSKTLRKSTNIKRKNDSLKRQLGGVVVVLSGTGNMGGVVVDGDDDAVDGAATCAATGGDR
jgi:hypothetical protein